MEGKHFCGLKFNWKYDYGYVNIKIPNCVSDALYFFQHTPPSQPQYSPHFHNPIIYGEKIQYSKGPNLLKHLNKKKKHVNLVLGTFFYYARAIDTTM